MYDFAVTSTDEIDHIWRGKFTGWKFLFFVNRYTSLAKAILIHLGLWHVAVVVSDSHCGTFYVLTYSIAVSLTRRSVDLI